VCENVGVSVDLAWAVAGGCLLDGWEVWFVECVVGLVDSVRGLVE